MLESTIILGKSCQKTEERSCCQRSLRAYLTNFLRGGANSAAAAAAASIQAAASAESGGKDTVDYSYDEKTYVWKGKSRSMYEHAVELIPRFFRDKSRRKILKGLTDLCNNNNSHINSGQTNTMGVVVRRRREGNVPCHS
mmetsp:Transcript_53030/g.128681  ORF Transcript_53030/g.128681 Transcript_53030/m.128681 type:complete len:140 (+) Transcript_53030:595-1014(+)